MLIETCQNVQNAQKIHKKRKNDKKTDGKNA